MTIRTRTGFDADALLRAAAADGEGGPRRDLARAYRELSARYRGGSDTPDDSALTDRHVQAYLAARLPATLAASRAVLVELAERRPLWQPASLLDLGAGPGPAMWAALETFAGITRIDLVERSSRMIGAGQRLASHATTATATAATTVTDVGAGAATALRSARWHRGAAQAPPPVDDADLTLASYLLGELPADERGPALAAWWHATNGALVLIDTGTPDGYARILAARAALLADGATITAPCPSDGPCPLPAGDWCHFSRRVERSAAHRALKDADLGHEDEKFAYLVASRGEPAHAAGRVLRAPRAHSGHVRLVLCTSDGRGETVVARSRRDEFRWARRARWGDAAPPTVAETARST
ncbi:ribosome assembly protein METTL17/RSM22, mitochondrial [Frankia sp. AiPs1]|uniref:small ribosomal subunit Rsm22 family protein n=1 Tax=Frankia sp. AiPa1 TaxID=573492 RepID=UPI00202B2523|nr:small ribosomal subunit Rsm22 family protein [Frankia sp. AiPa1]MCL9762048.1 small ribosomal subunit Rsm22 family protein [Frankia sp. AiPa1]